MTNNRGHQGLTINDDSCIYSISNLPLFVLNISQQLEVEDVQVLQKPTLHAGLTFHTSKILAPFWWPGIVSISSILFH